MESKSICPFCGVEIPSEIGYAIPQEETASRNYSIESHWSGSYMKETKQIRRFHALCCKDCYEENKKYDKITDKMAKIAIPIGAIVGIAFIVYMRNFKNQIEFGFDSIIAYVLGIFLGILVCSIPTMIVNLGHSKKVSYKKACKCNAVAEHFLCKK